MLCKVASRQGEVTSQCEALRQPRRECVSARAMTQRAVRPIREVRIGEARGSTQATYYYYYYYYYYDYNYYNYYSRLRGWSVPRVEGSPRTSRPGIVSRVFYEEFTRLARD